MSEANKTLLVVGASSDIARATARVFAAKGWSIILAGRDVRALTLDTRDLQIRGPEATPLALSLDILDTPSLAAFLDRLPVLPDTVLMAVGVLGDQHRAESDSDHAELIMRSNFEGPALFLGIVADRFETRGSGTIIGISSVAGERGRASNYVYGAAKAGFSAFLSGLRNRLARKNVAVVTVKPGFVRTRMTDGMKLPGALTAEPREVAEAIWKAVTKGRDVIYVRPVWRLIMLIIRTIPERIFKKLSL